MNADKRQDQTRPSHPPPSSAPLREIRGSEGPPSPSAPLRGIRGSEGPPPSSALLREIRGKNQDSPAPVQESRGSEGLLHEHLTRQIIGAAMRVLNELKPGLDERLYENALVLELQAMGLNVQQQKEHPVFYRGHFIGKLVPDLIVEEKIIADPKVVTAFNETHIAQMIGYLAITGLQVALLLNFKNAKLEWKRIVREKAAEKNSTADDADLRG